MSPQDAHATLRSGGPPAVEVYALITRELEKSVAAHTEDMIATLTRDLRELLGRPTPEMLAGALECYERVCGGIQFMRDQMHMHADKKWGPIAKRLAPARPPGAVQWFIDAYIDTARTRAQAALAMTVVVEVHPSVAAHFPIHRLRRCDPAT